MEQTIWHMFFFKQLNGNLSQGVIKRALELFVYLKRVARNYSEHPEKKRIKNFMRIIKKTIYYSFDIAENIINFFTYKHKHLFETT